MFEHGNKEETTNSLRGGCNGANPPRNQNDNGTKLEPVEPRVSPSEGGFARPTLPATTDERVKLAQLPLFWYASILF